MRSISRPASCVRMELRKDASCANGRAPHASDTSVGLECQCFEMIELPVDFLLGVYGRCQLIKSAFDWQSESMGLYESLRLRV